MGAAKLGGMKKGMCLETFSKPSDYSVLIPTSLDVGNKNNSKIVAPRFIWGTKKTLLTKRLPSTLSPAPLGAGKSVEFARYNTVYILLDPTPKGVGYDYFVLLNPQLKQWEMNA